MIRFVPIAAALLTWSALALGQSTPTITRIDPMALDIRKVNDRWQVLARQQVLKEFGRYEDAQTAVRILRELRVNQRGVIGTSRPVIEYWLTDGRSPAGLGLNRLPTIPFDRKSLKVEQLQGQWLVRDAIRPLFAFGPHEADARQALAVLQQHQFNRVGYVGDPPAMMYFVAAADVNPRPGQGPPSGPVSPLASLPLPSLACGNPFLFAMHEGEDNLPIAWHQVELLRDGAVWKLIEGKRTLAEVGISPDTARDALKVLRHYRVTEQCRTGTSPQSFSCYLVDGQAPRGVMFGLRTIAFQPEQLTLREQGNGWVIWNGNRPLMPAGATAAEAQQALRLIRAHGFDRLCWVGSPDGDGFRFLVKEK